ncbi:MAG: beta-lactamase family protein [Acidobacteriota bacterium]|nr:beta-lactamase family protein [Acidobacteriota bacterium]
MIPAHWVLVVALTLQGVAAHQPQRMDQMPQAPVKPAPAEIVQKVFGPGSGTPERPSVSVGWITDGSRPGFAGFGTTRVGTSELPNARTVYEIGSITKGLTGILLADMALTGEVSIHDTLDKFLPDAAGYPESVRAITLVQLTTHASGLPRLPGNLSFGMKDPSNPYAHYGAKELQAFLYGYTPPPGRTTITPEYSNLGAGLLGYVLALKAGTSYEALLKARVLEPLGMTDTTIVLTEDQKARLAPGHAKGVVVGNWDIDALAGAGAVRSTAADMAKLLAALMKPGGSRIGKAIALAIEPRGDLGAAKIGFGWITSTSPNGGPAFIWHNGGTGGYRTFIGFTKDRKAGIVALTNGSDQGPDALAVSALTQLAAR